MQLWYGQTHLMFSIWIGRDSGSAGLNPDIFRNHFTLPLTLSSAITNPKNFQVNTCQGKEHLVIIFEGGGIY